MKTFVGTAAAGAAAKSPGQHEKHYAPRSPAYRFELSDASRVVVWCEAHLIGAVGGDGAGFAPTHLGAGIAAAAAR